VKKVHRSKNVLQLQQRKQKLQKKEYKKNASTYCTSLRHELVDPQLVAVTE